MEACPPRLKMPGRWPVRPRLRVGMAPAVAGLNGAFVGAAEAAADAAAVSGSRLPASAPAVTAPVVLRKLRREAVAFWGSRRCSLMALSCGVILAPVHAGCNRVPSKPSERSRSRGGRYRVGEVGSGGPHGQINCGSQGGPCDPIYAKSLEPTEPAANMQLRLLRSDAQFVSECYS